MENDKKWDSHTYELTVDEETFEDMLKQESDRVIIVPDDNGKSHRCIVMYMD